MCADGQDAAHRRREWIADSARAGGGAKVVGDEWGHGDGLKLQVARGKWQITCNLQLATCHMTTYHIYPNVTLGDGTQIGEYVIIGEPPRGKREGELATRIGAGAVIRSHTVIYAGNAIGANFQTGH